ncbi:MAG: hypothetical protein KJ721_03395 [Nanoarchaeota archaeon]|nr:hypothetical protein [Nanoarchaeota archaeon]
MNSKTRETINSHLNKIISEFRFNNRKLKQPKECPCYEQNKPCHNVDGELNCFLCYCPEYDNSKSEGGCKINSQKGKWYFHDKLPKGKIWDCSDCDNPHREETIRKHLKKLFGVD